MTNITTDKTYKFTKAESELFSWTSWDGTNGNILTHKASGRRIYQMHWLDEQDKMAERVTGADAEAVKDFWAALKVLRNQKPPQPRYSVTVSDNKSCRYCGTYCYGDCRAS